MKKFINKVSLFFVMAGVLALCTSCENFMNGESLSSELDNAINYAKSTPHNIYVFADEGTGTITAGAGDQSLKVTDKITVSFSKASGYKFLKWEAVNKSDDSVSMSDYVTFKDETALETVATFVKAADNIRIRPLCEQTITTTGKFPVDDEKNGVERDSSIKLMFSYPLTEDNNLSKIKIAVTDTETGNSLNGAYNFKDPEIIDDQLLIMANVANRISVNPGSLKKVTVTIPEDFKYKSKYGEMEIGYEISHTYTINSTTSDKTLISYGTNDKNAGYMTINGVQDESVTQQYSIGEEVTAVFTVNDGYRFKAWDCTDDGSIVVSYPQGSNYDKKGYDSEAKTATINIRIVNSSKNVALKAVTEPIPTAQIKFSLDDNSSGVLKVNDAVSTGEVKTYRQDDVISVSFKKADAYKFVEWFKSDAAASCLTFDYGDYSDTNGYSSVTKTANVKITVKDGSTETITVKPVAPLIPSAKIKLDSAYGKLSPSGINTYKEGDTVSITFNADSDYQFMYWRVINIKTGAVLETQSNINFEDKEEFNTSFTLNEVPADTDSVSLKIEPYCIKRPKVVTASPTYDTDGVYSDRTIVVMFDKEMQESSLYWTEAELAEAGISKSEYTYLAATGKKDTSNNQYYYGYAKKSNADDITYKNITITELRDQSKNLLKYFQAPAFDASNKRLVRISTKIVNNKPYAPPAATEVLVTVKNGFYYLEKEKQVSLASEHSWVYYTNGKTDSTAPEIKGLNFASQKVADTVTNIVDKCNSAINAASLKTSELSTDPKTNVPLYNVKDGKIWIYSELFDGGSGPGKVTAEITKVDNTYYPDTEGKTTSFFLNPSVIGSSGEISEEIDISGLEEGFYKIRLRVWDKNEHETVSEYKHYFVYDVVPPAMPENFGNQITETRKEANKTYLAWNNPAIADIAKCVVKTEDVTDASKITAENPKDSDKNTEIECTKNQTLTDKTVAGLKNQHKYKHSFVFSDYAGNESTSTIEVVDNTAPNKASFSVCSRSSAANETVNWNNSSSSDFDHVVVKRYEGSTLKDTFTQSSKSTVSKEFTGLENQHKYTYYISAVDYSGNMSEENTYIDNSAPSAPTNLKETRSSASASTASWTNPSASDFAYTTITCKKEDGTSIGSGNISGTSKNFSGLVNQTRYVYTATAYDYSGNASTSVSFKDTTPPAKLTIRYTEGRNKRVSLFYTTPSDVDYAKTTVVYGSYANGTQEGFASGVARNTDSYYTSGTATNGSIYYYNFRTYDYSGNVSDVVTVSETVGAMPGMICYAPGNSSSNLFCSKNYWAGKNPIGVVCEGSNQSNVYIWGIGEVSGKPWGHAGDPRLCGDEDLKDAYYTVSGAGASGRTEVNVASGLRWYNYLNGTTDYHYKGSGTRTLSINWTGDTYWNNSIWNWCRSKNNNSAVTWFIPGVLEYKYILDNYDSMTSAYNTLKINGLDGTLLWWGYPYWAAAPRFYNGTAYAVEFNYRETGTKCDWEYFTNENSSLKRMYLTSTERDGDYFKQWDVDEDGKSIRAHAMAIINMN